MALKILILLFLSILIGCQSKKQSYEKEPWVEKPISEWPNFALTNSVQFSDTSYHNIANAFLINTGYDTIAASCKHIFMVFRSNGLKHIDLGKNFVDWSMYPKKKENIAILTGKPINTNPNEIIGEFNTLKVRDWIIFRPEFNNKSIYPLKLRMSPLKKHEVVHAVGWAYRQKTKTPAKVKMQVFNNLGKYCYVKPEISIGKSIAVINHFKIDT